MNLVSYEPWTLFRRFNDEINRFHGDSVVRRESSDRSWSPAVDVRETDNDFTVSAELPGLTQDGVSITIENGILCLSGEKKEEREEGKADSGGLVVERRYGRFQRSFSLPRGVDADKVSAKFSDGILTVTLPKAATAKPRQIKIS